MHCSDNCVGGVGVAISLDLGVVADRRVGSISPDLLSAFSILTIKLKHTIKEPLTQSFSPILRPTHLPSPPSRISDTLPPSLMSTIPFPLDLIRL
jgi:hypothetical protein